MTDSQRPQFRLQDRIDELLDLWDEQIRLGKKPEPAELCRDCPEMLFPLTQAIQQLQQMDGLLEPAAVEETHAQSNLPQSIGDFEILGELGRGGMGVVYEAVQESLNRQVALKVCPMSSRLSSRNRERFRRESRAAAMLHHTNIFPVFAVGEDEGNLFYAMQYIRGATLEDVVAELRFIWQHSPTVDTNLSNVRVNRSASAEASEVAQSLAGIQEPVSGKALTVDAQQQMALKQPTPAGRVESCMQALPVA